MVGKGEAETLRLTLIREDGFEAGEFGEEELVVVDKGIFTEIEGEVFGLDVIGESLDGGADFGNDGFEIFVLLGGDGVVFEAGRPFASGKKTFGPRERLPDGFGDEGGERMKEL